MAPAYLGEFEQLLLLAVLRLGSEAYASPVICDSRIYLRVAKNGNERQEILYCVGTK